MTKMDTHVFRRAEMIWKLVGLLTRTMVGGEIETRDLPLSVAQNADQLTLIGDPRTQTGDGVGVEVTGNNHLPPGAARIFLQTTKMRGMTTTFFFF